MSKIRVLLARGSSFERHRSNVASTVSRGCPRSFRLRAPGLKRLRVLCGSFAPSALKRSSSPLARSPLLVDADDEVAFRTLGARDPQLLLRVQPPQHQGVALPAQELLDQHRLVALVDDDVAAAGRRLERVDVEQPTQ